MIKCENTQQMSLLLDNMFLSDGEKLVQIFTSIAQPVGVQ